MCYKYAEKYNYDIIRFNTYRGNNIVKFKDNIIKKIIYQPELSTHIFNENDKFKIAKSLFKINNVGYYYIKNSINTLFPISQLQIKFTLIHLKFIFEYSKNIKKEKDMSNNFGPVIKLLNIPNSIFIIKNDFIFYKNFINTFIKCKFISMENKRILESFKNLIEFSTCSNLTNFK